MILTELPLIVLVYISCLSLAGVNGQFTLKPTITPAAPFHCLRCDETVYPEYCDTVRRCGVHEKCYVDTFVSHAGIIRYDVGCRDTLQCNQTKTVGKRDENGMRFNSSFQSNLVTSLNKRTGGLLVCSECCSGDLCNNAGCGNQGYPTPRGPICYNCPQQATANDCRTIKMCGQDEVCMLQKTADPVTQKPIYESKCEARKTCHDKLSNVTHTAPASVPIGKRQQRGVHNAQNSCQMQCCNTSLCNSNCNAGSSSTSPAHTPTKATPSKPSPSTPTAPQPTMNTCADVYSDCATAGMQQTICPTKALATQFCKKSCGYCPGSGHWLDWSAWSSCSATCGNNAQKVRLRMCSSQNVSDCVGKHMQQMTCSAPCPVDGHWSDWTSWSTCSETCGMGNTVQRRTCTNPLPANGGKDCIDPTLRVKTKTCQIRNCPGHWLDWSAWSSCSATCGNNAQKVRLRMCSSQNVADCVGTHMQQTTCSAPCPVDGHWSDWTSWSSCSKTCGMGSTAQSRTCTNPSPANGGQFCTDPTLKINTKTCQIRNCPVDGHWSDWTPWSSCSETCGMGNTVQSRTCTNPSPANGGNSCTDPTLRVKTKTCQIRNCPVDGHWSDWTPWTSCSETCGMGSTVQSRTCTNPSPANGGKDCTDPTLKVKTKTCQIRNCPVDGDWSDWTSWSSCSETCGMGSTAQTRTCTNPSPANGGKGCIDPTYTMKTKTCQISNCPVDGHWSHWTSWSSCSVSCGTGMASRIRTCTNPSPSYGGQACANQKSDTKICTQPPCSVPNDCLDIKQKDSTATTGLHRIELWQSKKQINVYCDMDTDNGGWTVLQNRFDGSTNFYKSFAEYRLGFGNFLQEFWLGLDPLYEMLQKGSSELRIEVTNKYGTFSETYPYFSISSGPDYIFHLSSGTGPVGQSLIDMTYSDGAPFSTYDHDRDSETRVNCAEALTSAWWFTSCMKSQFDIQMQYLQTAKLMFRRT